MAARARARHQSLNAYLIDVLTREADTPTMSEVLADIEAIRRPTGLTGEDAVAAVREARDAQDPARTDRPSGAPERHAWRG